jgi:hypothetical protein
MALMGPSTTIDDVDFVVGALDAVLEEIFGVS